MIATEGRGKKLALITERFSTYMVPRPVAVKAEMRRGGTEKPDYRHRSQTGRVEKR
jgi:hypothetical protein